jgi:ubiquinol-cytochrome c reductase cytochrome b subunit
MVRFFSYFKNIYSLTFNYSTPSNLNYFWNFGSLALFFLVIQIITGLSLTWYYIAHIDFAFSSVEFIMREVNSGWLLRYLHSNGASFFFFVVYLHIARSLFYGSYQQPRVLVWLSGLCIYVLMILTAFLGYVLPWGQMSFWAATVITSLTTVFPYVGSDLVMLVWGGFGIGQQTLTRFYSFHFIFPFVICIIIFLHLLFLHYVGSSNPVTFLSFLDDKVSFHPYYTYKDVFGIFLFLFIYFVFVFFYPNLLGHPLNYIPANPGVTPPHIVPEWYFLPFHGILRAIPSKILGVIAMLGSLLSLALLPFLVNFELRNLSFNPKYQITLWFFLLNFIMLGWVGANVLEYPFVILSQFFTFLYFIFFITVTRC